MSDRSSCLVLNERTDIEMHQAFDQLLVMKTLIYIWPRIEFLFDEEETKLVAVRSNPGQPARHTSCSYRADTSLEEIANVQASFTSDSDRQTSNFM